MLRIVSRPSPNFNERTGAGVPDMLIMHYTGMQTAEAAIARLTDAAARVSAHYTVDEDGTVHAHVDEQLRAWHAGVSSWRGHADINSRSIGIEIVNPGHEFGYRPFPAVQIAAVVELSRGILSRHHIPARNVVGHSDVAPARKEDPGELFPWALLAGEGIGLWPVLRHVSGENLLPGMSGEAVARLQRGLQAYGYGIDASGLFDEATRLVVVAFQRHFRPSRLDGVADGETQGLLAALLESLDVPS
jgi:N-acetylmuramoyl-L-alanine amidase